jgi:phage host-nuclease inhibitor protein Gam
MNTRLKPKILTPQTREEAEAVVGEIAALKNFEAQTKALMDQRLQEVRQEYEGQLASVSEDLTVPLMRIQAWAESNPDLFSKTKSIQMLHGIVGWRISNPTVKLLSGFTWTKVLERIKALGHDSFIRKKEDVDKECILATREHLLEGDLRQMGVKIAQDESFFVEPKATPTETRLTA